MANGAIIVNYGNERIIHECHASDEDSIKRYLQEEVNSLVKRAKERYPPDKIGEFLKTLSVKYDPEYDWDA
jgi:hypothetical protein